MKRVSAQQILNETVRVERTFREYTEFRIRCRFSPLSKGSNFGPVGTDIACADARCDGSWTHRIERLRTRCQYPPGRNCSPWRAERSDSEFEIQCTLGRCARRARFHSRSVEHSPASSRVSAFRILA